MKKYYRFAGACLSFALFAGVALAQRPRMEDSAGKEKAPPTAAATNKAANTALPTLQPVRVKYEGGYFGYNQKMDGTLTLDHMNEQLVFRNKDRKELITIPYAAVMAAYADTQSRRPAAASVIGSSVPYGMGLPALLIKKKYRYLNMQYSDPDSNAFGVVSFKFENKEILGSILQSVADETGLSPRGEVFVRKRRQPANSASDQQEIVSPVQ